MYKVLYRDNYVEIQQNVSPAGWHPLWDTKYVANSMSELPENVELILTEDQLDTIAWFFEDLAQGE